MVLAVAFFSLLDPTRKEKNIANCGWGVGSTVNVAAHPDKIAKTTALVKGTEITMDDGGCVWSASYVPSVVPLAVVVAGFAVVGGF